MDNTEVRPVGLSEDMDKLFSQQEKKQGATAAMEAARVIKSLDDGFSFTSNGYTSDLKITHGDPKTQTNVSEYVKLIIKSVGVADVIEQTEKSAPRPPTQLRKYKKGSAEAREWGYNFDFQVREQDLSDPDYLEKLSAHNRESGQIIMLSGLGYDIKDPTNPGQLALEGSDLNVPNKIHNKDVALAVLKRMGISGGHYAQILKDIRGLTEDIEEQERLG